MSGSICLFCCPAQGKLYCFFSESYVVLYVKGRGKVLLRPTAVKVEAVCAYQILVEFDSGEKIF